MSIADLFRALFDLPEKLEALSQQAARVFGPSTSLYARVRVALEGLILLAFTSLITCLWVFLVLAPALLLALIYGVFIKPNFPSFPEGVVAAVCALLTVAALVIYGRFAGAGGQVNGVPMWQLIIGGPVLALASFLVGAWNHETVDRYGQVVLRRVDCVITRNFVVLRSCVAEFPNAILGGGWPERLRAETDRLATVAQQAYEDAIRTRTPERFTAAKAAIELLIWFEPAIDGPINQTRLRALALGPDMFTECTRCPEMRVVLPPGDTSIPFAIGVFEVSVDQWLACARAGFCRSVSGSDPTLPVTSVTAQQVRSYLDYISDQSRQSYRLPLESEWRLASSGQADGRVARIEGGLDQVCHYYNSLNRDTLPGQAPYRSSNLACDDRFAPGELASANPTAFEPGRKGHFFPNDNGIYHMLGNASEWTMDSCDTVWNGREVAGGRVVLGGSNADPPELQDGGIVINEACNGEWLGHPSRGFRVARSL